MSKTKRAIVRGDWPGPTCPACGANCGGDGAYCLVCDWAEDPEPKRYILTTYDYDGTCANGRVVTGEARAFETAEAWKQSKRVSRVTVDEVNGMKARRRRLTTNG